jgi:hypothetical protein
MVKEWRAALPLVLCFQQLLRGAECFNLCGANVSAVNRYFRVEVVSSKNHPTGFVFRVPVDEDRPNCVGVFLSDYIDVMGIMLG